jgi:hypothetical protein
VAQAVVGSPWRMQRNKDLERFSKANETANALSSFRQFLAISKVWRKVEKGTKSGSLRQLV